MSEVHPGTVSFYITSIKEAGYSIVIITLISERKSENISKLKGA